MHPGLNLNYLKYFYDAVEKQSVSEAAKINFVTQSAVSQAIIKLEKALNLELITHSRNFFKLTVEGEIIFLKTQQLFNVLKSMQDLSQEQSEVVSGKINVTCTQSIAINLLSVVLPKLRDLYPQVTVKLKISKIDQIQLLLKKGVMDMGIVVESELCDSFQKEEIKTGSFQIYSKTGILSREVYVDHNNGLFVHKLMQLYHKRFKKDLEIMQELDSWQLLAKCASQGIGCCFLPDFIADKDPSLKVCGELKSIPYRIIAFYPNGTKLTRAAKVLVNLLQNN